MSDSLKNKITSDLEKAKAEGQVRSERIREIVRDAIEQASAELKEGSTEIRSVVKSAVATVIDNFQEKGGEIKEEVTASLEGAIEAISRTRRQAIAKNQTEVKQLQAQIDSEEQELQAEIDGVLADVQETEQESQSAVKEAVESAIDTLKDTEEMALMRKRYAQLQTQIAILKANLSARYGERYEEVKHHLDDAQKWYEQAQPQAEVVAEQVKQKRSEFEEKLGKAGTALAKKEREVKQLLRELWKSITDTEVSDKK
ncbi:MAG: histidine kinase [Coleofasciculaceae cyanobacterium]